jgi:hypothetical protein
VGLNCTFLTAVTETEASSMLYFGGVRNKPERRMKGAQDRGREEDNRNLHYMIAQGGSKINAGGGATNVCRSLASCCCGKWNLTSIFFIHLSPAIAVYFINQLYFILLVLHVSAFYTNHLKVREPSFS